MAISWNEIKARSIAFSKEWENTEREEADAKEFLVEFLSIFGIRRHKVATFEHKVKKLNDADGYIDLLWKGMLLVEMKSKGKDLDKAYQQAKDYCHGLNEKEIPQMIMVCDFHRFQVYDENGFQTNFTLRELTKHIKNFALIAGYKKRTFSEQDPVNIEAAQLMGKLHDKLKAIGYDGHQLELFLVRLLFCLFADDTNIFESGSFQDYIELKSNIDGSDLAAHISMIFQTLNTAEDKRFKNLDESLASFPYINGKLFEEILPVASFDSEMRHILLESCRLDWGKISPAIFGSLFQSVMDEKARRNLGAHYTSEKNIFKLIKPLFLDDLWNEFENCKSDKRKLQKLHDKIRRLRFLDPACGCGNFLIITYREIRLLELEIVKEILKGQQVTSINDYMLVDVDQFYGIEYEEFPSQIAQVAMWLMDHQMNEVAGNQFGEYFKRIPLKKSASIVCRNALEIDWQSLLNKDSTVTLYANNINVISNNVQEPPVHYETLNVHAVNAFINPEKQKQDTSIRYDYIFGNPPFIGSKMMNQNQRNEVVIEFNNSEGSGVLDYVAAWYIKAAKYIKGTETKVALVSTNSIVQGEQTSILWGQLLSRFDIKIHFAHRTFKWSNEAKGNAAVYCVIIGFAGFDTTNKRIFDYDTVQGEPHEIEVKNINPYLADAKDVLIYKRSTPLCNVPKMSFGNMPLDGGHLLLSNEEKIDLLAKEPKAEKFIKPLISAFEFLNGQKRWCLWMVNIEPQELIGMPEVMKRVALVKKFRLDSIAPSTQKFAETPYLFRDRNQPETFIVIPRVSSENRKYIPIGFFDKNSIVSDTCMSIPNGTLFHFGILTSTMHISWVKYVCGRLKSDFRYSKDIVYNNYPWPENPSDKQIQTIEKAAEKVLQARNAHPNSSLADMYNPTAMPLDLIKAHNELDKAVDLAYRSQAFITEEKRMEFLFELYEKYTADLFSKGNSKKKN